MVRGAAETREIVPAAAAQHPVIVRCWALRICCIAIIGTIPILTPLPHVAVHVMKSPGIGFLLPNRVRQIIAIARVPPNVINRHSPNCRKHSCATILTSRSCATCVFPFSLSRQTCTAFQLRVDSGNKLLAVRPRHTLNRAAVITL